MCPLQNSTNLELEIRNDFGSQNSMSLTLCPNLSNKGAGWYDIECYRRIIEFLVLEGIIPQIVDIHRRLATVLYLQKL